jgi:hypothetical protein
MLKHHCSTLFLPTPRTLQSTISSPYFIDETNLSSNCFAFSFFVAETPLTTTLHHFFHDAETPLFSMFDFFPMLKHHRSTLFDFLPILEHHCSAVLHPHHLFHLSLLPKHQSFTIVRQQAFTFVPLNSRPLTQSKSAATTASPRTSMISGWLNKPNGKARYVNIV